MDMRKQGGCDFYESWTDRGLQIMQCLEFWEGQCNEPMSPHYKCDCPWPNGYPCPADDGEGRWKAPTPTPEQILARNCLRDDREVED